MSEVVIVGSDESPPSGDATPAAEHAEAVAIDATVAAAVAAAEAANEAIDANVAASVAEGSAALSTGAAEAASNAALVADDAAYSAARSLEEVYALAESIPERVLSAVTALLAPAATGEEETIDEVVQEALIPEVEPRGQHFWFKNKIWGN